MRVHRAACEACVRFCTGCSRTNIMYHNYMGSGSASAKRNAKSITNQLLIINY